MNAQRHVNHAKRGGILLLVAGLLGATLAALLVVPVLAVDFTVNSTGDTSDVVPGDGVLSHRLRRLHLACRDRGEQRA